MGAPGGTLAVIALILGLIASPVHAAAKKKATPSKVSLYFARLAEQMKGKDEKTVKAKTPVPAKKKKKKKKKPATTVSAPVEIVIPAVKSAEMIRRTRGESPEVKDPSEDQMYYGRECKEAQNDDLLCMTCIAYFGGKYKTLPTEGYIEGSLEKNREGEAGMRLALMSEQVAGIVVMEMQAKGTSACDELHALKPNRFEDAYFKVFPWLSDENGIDTTMTNVKRLKDSDEIARRVLQDLY